MGRWPSVGVLLVLLSGLAVLSPLPAQGVESGVLTAQSFTTKSSSTRVSESADFVTFGDSSTASSGGMSATFPGTLWRVVAAPPAGTRFESGRVYATRVTRTDTVARLTFANYLPFTSADCTSHSGSVTGTLRIRRAGYAGDLLTELAADYSATCVVSGVTEEVHGSIRMGTDEPWSALLQEYSADLVPLGESNERPVTVTSTGPGSAGRLGAASISGLRAADYTITDNGCQGRTLATGENCQVMVRFAPETIWMGTESPRVATLTLETAEHVAGSLRVRLHSSAVERPAAPRSATTYPVPTGIGIAVEPSPEAPDGYYVERRLSPAGAWERIADLPAGSDAAYTTDRDVPPGQHVDYRAASYVGEWPSPWIEFDGTRPEQTPVPTARRSVSFGSLDDYRPWLRLTDGEDGTIVRTWNNGVPTIDAQGAQPTPVEAGPNATVTLPLVPGPGLYRGAAAGGVSTSPHLCDPTGNDTTEVTLLQVRRVLYDEDRVPVVLDASWTRTCDRGGTARAEIRLGVGADDHTVSAAPGEIGRLTTWAARSREAEVVVTNHGPGAAEFDEHAILGDASQDWRVAENTCAAAPVQPGGTCEVGVSFSATADGTRPAVLELAQRTAEGPMAPVLVTLDGFGATLPRAHGDAVRSAGATLLSWGVHDGGMPALSYDIERSPRSAEAWAPLRSQPATLARSYADQDIVSGQLYDYRIRATSEVGTGPWQTMSRYTELPTTVYSGSWSADGLHALLQVGGYSARSPVIDLTEDPGHDYRDPAVWGYRLTSSVSVSDGTDGEYDLWTGTLSQPRARRLTTMPGAERQAVFSPDGSTIAFTSVTGTSSSVWTVPVAGGEPQLVRSSASHPAWDPQGTSLVMEDTTSADAPLLRVDLPSLGATPIDGTAGARWPAVSAAGALAFVAADGHAMELAPGSSVPTWKIARWFYPRDLAYDADGGLLASTFTSAGEPRPPSLLLTDGIEPAPVSTRPTDPVLHVTATGLAAALSGTVTFGWGTDRPGLVSGYEVQVREASPTQGFSAYHLPAGWSGPEQAETVDEYTQKLVPGQEVCLRARLQEGSGLWSHPREQCVARPLDDRALSGPGAARRIKASTAYFRTLTSIARKGVVLRTGVVTTRQVGVLATTCPTCGALRVKLGTKLVGTVSLTSSKERHQVLLPLPALTEETTGRLSLTTTSARRVRLDGLLLSR